jgi:G3E family GTPase
MISTTLVLGKSASEREQAIANEISTADLPFRKTAVLLEGLASGKSPLESKNNVVVVRIAAGCLCCSSNMIMRIYLNRLIAQKPQQLFLSLSTATHLEQIQQFLSTPDYQQHLLLTKVLNLNAIIT